MYGANLRKSGLIFFFLMNQQLELFKILANSLNVHRKVIIFTAAAAAAAKKKENYKTDGRFFS